MMNNKTRNIEEENLSNADGEMPVDKSEELSRRITRAGIF